MASGIGQILRDARRGAGVTLEEAAARTHLRETYLAALERDDIDTLGLDPAYVRGTLRTYAAYLGLDSEALVTRHRSGPSPAPGATGGAGPPRATAGGAQPAGRRVSRTVIGVLGLIVLAVVAFMLGDAFARGTLPTLLGSRPAPADPVGARTASPGVARQAAPSESEDEAVLPAPALRLKLVFMEESWARVVADGRTEFEGTHGDGVIERVRADRRILVRTGVGGAIRFTFNGTPYGRIARNRSGPVDVVCDVAGGCRPVD